MQAINATDANFAAEVLQSELPVIVDVWAPGCAPCKMLGPMLQRFAASQPNRFKLVMVNLQDFAETAAQLGVRATPTLLAYRDGEELGRRSGAMIPSQLHQWLEDHL